MITFQNLAKKPRHFQSFTGLTPKEFSVLANEIKPLWKKREHARLSRINRIRGIGAGRRYALVTFENQLLLALVWSKLYPTHVLLEYLFNVDESTVCRTLKRILPLLEGQYVLPPRPRRKIGTLEELRKIVPDIDSVLIDSTEQSVLRPKDKRRRKPLHSGKKRAFTMKTQIVVSQGGVPVHISESIGGRRNDCRFFTETVAPKLIPPSLPIYVDRGYLGAEKNYPHLTICMPKLRRAGAALSRRELKRNHMFQKVRIAIEHTFALFKKFKVLSHIYRHSRKQYNSMFQFVANIVAFRMRQRATIV